MHVQNHPQKKRNKNDEQKEQTVKKKTTFPENKKEIPSVPFFWTDKI